MLAVPSMTTPYSAPGCASEQHSTPLKSNEGPSSRTRLSSRASQFIPGAAPALQCTPAAHPAPNPPYSQDAKMPVRCVIEGAFGNRLGGLNMMDLQTHTQVEVCVHAMPSDMAGPCAVDPQAYMRALYTLMHAFKSLGHKIHQLDLKAAESQLHIKYCEARQDSICWEFGQYGYCPRGNTCRWQHAATEVFVINMLVQPLAMGMDMSAIAMAPATGEFPAGMCGYIMAAPMNGSMEQVPGMVYAVPVPFTPMETTTPAHMLQTTSAPICFGDLDSGDPEGDPAAQTTPGQPAVQKSVAKEARKTPTGSTCSTPTQRTDRLCWADIEDEEDA